MRRKLALPMVIGLVAMALAGCRADSDSRGGDRSSPQSQFGPTFASAFNAPETADPIDPRPGDAGPLSLTDDPIDF